jgi:NADH dehydrogenase
MAIVGRGQAVADFGWGHFSGIAAWLAWLSIHIFNLVEFENRLLVFIQWAWSYFTGNRSARLITGEPPPSFSESENLHTSSKEQQT